MIARHLYRRPVRTGLTALGVAAGVVAIVAFSTLVRGAWASVDALVHINDTELIVFQANVAADIFSVLDEAETRARLLATPGVRAAVGSLWHVLRVERQPFCLAVGLRLEDMAGIRRNLVAGRLPEADDELLLGSIAARVLERDVGGTVDIRGEAYRVAGILHTDVVFFNGAVVLSLPRLQRLTAKEGCVTAFQVDLGPGADPEAVTALIEATYPDLAAIGGAGEYRKTDQGLVIAEGLVWAVSFIAVVVGSIIVANTMWMSVLERTHEIGVLRAVGWSRRRVVLMVMAEAAGVGLLACGVGCPAGAGLAKLATALPVAEQFLEPAFGLRAFAMAVGVALVLSVIGALLPAWRAARISPAEALRYE